MRTYKPNNYSFEGLPDGKPSFIMIIPCGFDYHISLIHGGFRNEVMYRICRVFTDFTGFGEKRVKSN